MDDDNEAELLPVNDESKPKIDELKFVHDLQSHYEQSETAVIRRIREVRRLRKNGYIDNH